MRSLHFIQRNDNRYYSPRMDKIEIEDFDFEFFSFFLHCFIRALRAQWNISIYSMWLVSNARMHREWSNEMASVHEMRL